MIHFIELIYAFISVTKFGISFEQRSDLKQLDLELNAIFEEITAKYINGELIQVISSGKEFEEHWKTFYSQMEDNIQTMDYGTRICNCLAIKSIHTKTLLLNCEQQIIHSFEDHLIKCLYVSMKKYAENELSEIKKSLSEKNFFNISNENLGESIIDSLKLGKKYTPKTKYNIKSEIANFNMEVGKILENFLLQEFSLNTKINSGKVAQWFQKTTNHVNSKPLYEFLTVAETAYKKELKSFKNQLYLNKSKLNNLPNETFYRKAFETNSKLIILEGDKNVRYVYIYLSDLLKQYVKINIHQHFGKTTIDEKWYIESIINFIKNAFNNLPNELSAIFKKSDFNIKIKKPEIGVLRLQPKILKLKQINHSNVEKTNVKRNKKFYE